MAGTAKTALAAGLAKSTSAEAVVPVRLTGVAVPPPIGSATETVPSSITSRWTLFAASVALRPAVTISFGSVSAGALLGLLLWHPPRAKPSVAARTRTAGIRRDMRLLGVGVASATIRCDGHRKGRCGGERCQTSDGAVMHHRTPRRRPCPMGDSATVIDRIDVHGYDLTYAHGDYVMSSGRIVNVLPSTVVRIRTRGGLEGFGETCPLGSTYLPGFAEGARVALRELAPALIGIDATNLGAVTERMDTTLRGHEYAKSALDVACWDILGRATGTSVSTLLGGVLESVVPLYVAVPLGPPAEMAAFVERERAAGVHHFQLKLGTAPEADLERVAAVHAVTGPEDALIGDANGAWRRQDAIIAARLLGGFDRLRLEQPCLTLEECIAVRRLTTLPMVLDEVITDLATLIRAVAVDAMDHVNLKIGRVGGLTKARLMRDAAVALGLTLTIEDSWGGDLVTAAVAHLASGVPSGSLFAASYMNDWTLEHVAGHQPRSRHGVGPVPDGAGLGLDVDPDRLGVPLFSV